jgi:hypothetical protein
MMEIKDACKIFVGTPKGKRPLWRCGLVGRIILKWVL